MLDEATSTLDPEGEEQVLRAIETLAHERIVLMIAHRLNTIRTADTIILLNEGRVVDAGPHAALLQRSAMYAALMRAFVGEEVFV